MSANLSFVTCFWSYIQGMSQARPGYLFIHLGSKLTLHQIDKMMLLNSPNTSNFLILLVCLDGDISKPLRESDRTIDAGEACTYNNHPHRALILNGIILDGEWFGLRAEIAHRER